jgi:restriction system protein
MAMPDFQTVMLPLLQLAGDSADHTMASAISTLADSVFHLTPEERAELLPGGSQKRFHNRVYWAAAHLRAARLIQSPSRGLFRIADAGKTVLASPPSKITINFLKQFPGYSEFKSGSPTPPAQSNQVATDDTQTPDEVIAAQFKELNAQLAADILAKVLANPPDFLEKLVLRLLVAMNYGGAADDASELLGGPGDEGVDGVVRLDRLGLDPIYVQAKRWNASHPVTSKEMRDFIGSLQIKNAARGVFITTSTFTADASEAAKKGGKQIVLINGTKLAELMIEHGVGVQERVRYILRAIDSDFFDAV